MIKHYFLLSFALHQCELDRITFERPSNNLNGKGSDWLFDEGIKLNGQDFDLNFALNLVIQQPLYELALLIY